MLHLNFNGDGKWGEVQRQNLNLRDSRTKGRPGGRPFDLERGGWEVSDLVTTAAGGGVAGILAAGIVQVALAAINKRSGKGDHESNVAVAQAIERQAVATEGLAKVIESVGQRLTEQGEALRRLEVGQAHILAATSKCNGRVS